MIYSFTGHVVHLSTGLIVNWLVQWSRCSLVNCLNGQLAGSVVMLFIGQRVYY